MKNQVDAVTDEQLGAAVRTIATRIGGSDGHEINWYAEKIVAFADSMPIGDRIQVDRVRVMVRPESRRIDGLLEHLTEMITGAPCGVTGFVQNERNDPSTHENTEAFGSILDRLEALCVSGRSTSPKDALDGLSTVSSVLSYTLHWLQYLSRLPSSRAWHIINSMESAIKIIEISRAELQDLITPAKSTTTP